MRPKTRYAKSGDLSIAYQVSGEGPPDLVHVPGWISHLEHAWEDPGYARFLRQMSSFARFIRFDKRGTGLSDREIGFPSLEERMDDLRAVMDAVGAERATILGTSEGGNMSMLFAAAYPERVSALILFGCFAKRLWSPDYPWASTAEERDAWIDDLERNWGDTIDLQRLAPSAAGDSHFCEWFSAHLRFGASPRAAITLTRLNSQIDVRDILPTIRVPTLVLHRRGDLHVKLKEGQYLADHIPGAKFVELPGDDHIPWVGNQDALVNEIHEFVTGTRSRPDPDRVLATILFTDIVDSTGLAARLGDRKWRELLEQHHALVRKQLAAFRGREVKTTGDGFLATFDGPGRALLCAVAIRNGVRPLGIEIRAGVHIGECELQGNDISGIGVHIAARILGLAEAGEILASSTIKDLVVGSGIDFREHGTHELKGVPGEWHLFTATAPDP